MQMGRDFCSQRVVNLWYSLPQIVVEVDTLGDFFKAETTRFLISKGVKGKRKENGIQREI